MSAATITAPGVRRPRSRRLPLLVGMADAALLAGAIAASFTLGSTGTSPAGGSAVARLVYAWPTPESAASAFLSAASRGDCTTLTRVVAPTSLLRRGVTNAELCRRERATFRGDAVVSARKVSSGKGTASVDVRTTGPLGSFDLVIETQQTGKSWSVVLVS